MDRAHDGEQAQPWPRPGRSAFEAGRPTELAGHWFAASHRSLRWDYDVWFHPATFDVASALLGAGEADDAVVRLGAARAAAGHPFEDTLADLSTLLDALPESCRRRLDDAHLSAALSAGFESGAHRDAPDTGFAGPSWLRARLARLEEERRGTTVPPVESHAVLVVDVGAGSVKDRRDGLAVHTAAGHVRDHLPLAEQVVCLAPRRFGVLVHRHPGLALSAANLRSALAGEPALADVPVSVWVELLPADGSTVRFVTSLSTSAPRPGATARAGLAGAAMSTAPLRPVRVRGARRLVGRTRRAWHEGVSLLVASAAVLLMAFGLAQAVGPRQGSPGVGGVGPVVGTGVAAPLAGGVTGRTVPTTVPMAGAVPEDSAPVTEAAVAAAAASAAAVPGPRPVAVPPATAAPAPAPRQVEAEELRPQPEPEPVPTTSPPPEEPTEDTTPPTTSTTQPPADPGKWETKHGEEHPGRGKGSDKDEADDDEGAEVASEERGKGKGRDDD